MTSRFVNPRPQFLFSDGNPINDGELTFFETGTDTPKDTFKDAALQIINPNPLPLNADGRVPNCFYAGTARVVLNSASAGQVWDADGVGQFGSGFAFDTWNSVTEYEIGAIVTGPDGNNYRSIQNANQGNNPVSSPTFWEQIEFVRTWNPSVTYNISDIVKASDGYIYRSIIDDNTNNDPANGASPTQWGSPLFGLPDQDLNTDSDVQFNSLELAVPLSIVNGGTDATTSSDARSNLGVAIGSDVQAYSANLDSIDQDLGTGDSPAFAGLTATTADINGGTIDGTVIGGTTAAAGSFTSLGVSGNVTVGGVAFASQYRTDGTNGTPLVFFSTSGYQTNFEVGSNILRLRLNRSGDATAPRFLVENNDTDLFQIDAQTGVVESFLPFQANTIQAQSGSTVTIDDDLDVTGELTLDTINATGSFVNVSGVIATDNRLEVGGTGNLRLFDRGLTGGFLGSIQYYGLNDAGQNFPYASINAVAGTTTDGSESGELRLNPTVGGVATEVMRVRNNNVAVFQPILVDTIQAESGATVTVDDDFRVSGAIAPDALSVVSIVNNEITVTKNHHVVGAGTINTINGGVEGQLLTLRTGNNGADATLANDVGNLRLNAALGNFTLENVDSRIMLQYSNGRWCEISRSNNTT